VQKRPGEARKTVAPSKLEIEQLLDRVLQERPFPSPSHVYLAVVRESLRNHWDVAAVSYRAVSDALKSRGLKVDPASGKFVGSHERQTELWE